MSRVLGLAGFRAGWAFRYSNDVAYRIRVGVRVFILAPFRVSRAATFVGCSRRL